MTLLNLTNFNTKFLTRPITKIGSNPKYIKPSEFSLPYNSTIHFIADSEQALGIDSAHPLLRNIPDQAYIYHVVDLKHVLGTVSSTNVDVTAYMRKYQKSHLNIKPVTNLDRALSNNKDPIIINYSILPKLNKYTSNTLVVYQEWFNIRATMWDMVNQIDGRREQFICYKMPQVLPTKADLIKYAANFKSSGISDFHTSDTLNILELWRIISTDVESPDLLLSEQALENTNLVFMESGIMVIIQLQELINLATENHASAGNTLYTFLDKLIALRNPIDSNKLEAETVEQVNEPVDNTAITKLIKEHGSLGYLSEAEQKGLLKLSQKYKTIQDPHGSGVTLDKMVVTPDNLKLDKVQVIKKADSIHDETMLYSAIQELDRKYITEVLPKDIIQTVLMLHPAGVIVKDIKIKQKNTAATKANVYSIQVQPINGAASTIHFTIPVINPDGTFLAGGVLYRMDKQVGDLPIVKIKPDMVSLTSYYGKIFVSRNDSSANNFSKWILKEIISRYNNPEDNSVKELVYGINKINDKKVPRAYTAISESVSSFNNNDLLYLDFKYNKIKDNYTKAEIKKIEHFELTPCGRDIKTNIPLGMDMSGIIYLVLAAAPNGNEDKPLQELNTIQYIIDPFTTGGPVEYAEFSILNKRMPVILAFTYIFGLDEALKKLNIPFTLSPTNTRLPYNSNEYKIRFKDIVYVVDITNLKNRLLVGGFSAIKNDITRYKGSDFNRQPSYSSILSNIDLTVYHLRELKLMWDMYIEPITLGLLQEMGEPTNLPNLLVKATSLLTNDYVPDLNSTRYKGYERLCGMMYHQLITAMRAHRSSGALSNVGVTINPNAVYLDILQDPTVSIVEESNPIHNLKEHEAFTHSGAGGRSSVTMTKDTRGFSEHDLGTVSEATPDSAKVGIRAYFSADPNITSLRGTTEKYDETKHGATNVISTSALLAPAITHDDGKRINFTQIQNSHTVACDGYTSLPYRTGYEEVIGNRVDNLFVVTADEDGIVKVVKPDILTVEYYKPTSKPIAVIIKGNEKYITDKTIKPMADKFYNEIKKLLEAKGYAVEFDRGLAYTSPRGDATVWLGHSMGADRLQYAPKGIITLEIESLSHTNDPKLYDKNGRDPKHYQLSPDDIKRIESLRTYTEHDLNYYSKSYELGIKHGTVAGTVIPHTRITDLKENQKVSKGDVIIYNSGFFERSLLNPANVVYKAGVVARVALLDNSDTLEDGCTISSKLADKLVTPGTTAHGLVLNFDTIIHNLVTVGEKVEPETILCTLESHISDMLDSKDAEAIKALHKIAANNPKAKVYGTVSRIEVFYYGKIEDMHVSLQKIVEKYDSNRAKRAKLLDNGEAKTGKVDETIRVAGKKLVEKQVGIKIYIDGEISMGNGDKVVFGNALKATCSSVSTNIITSEDGNEIDAFFGYQSVSDRIVGSPEVAGLMNSVMIELSKQMGLGFKQ